MRSLGTLACLLTVAAPALAQRRNAPPPANPQTYPVPAAAAPGQSTDVTFIATGGLDFGDARGVWTSFPAKATPAETSKLAGGKKGVTYHLSVPADVPVGIYAIQVATAGGVSDLRLFMIDDLPTVPAATNNTAPDKAQSLPPAAAVDGVCDPLGRRYFRLAEVKGKRVSVEVVAQRLGSKLDPLVRLLDPAGREVAYNDDAPGVGSDCRLAYTFAADGDYLIELRDANYEGGSDYRYRLRVGDFPLPAVPFPLAGRRGAATEFAFPSPDGDRLGPLRVTVPPEAERAWLNVKSPGGQGSGFVPVLAADKADAVEIEPNGIPEAANPITLPAALSGHLDRPNDRDVFRFDGKKGDRVAFRGRTRSVGAAGELYLQLRDAKGTKLAESKAADAKAPITAPVPDEPSLEAALPRDGTFFVVVEDLARAGGPGMVYRLEGEPIRPGFSLGVEANKVEGAAGESVTLKVTCARRDYDGPINLSLGGAAAAWANENNIIKAGAADTDLKIKLPAAPPAALLRFTIIGQAEIAGEKVTRPVGTMPALRKLFPQMPFPPPEFDGLIGVGFRKADAP